VCSADPDDGFTAYHGTQARTHYGAEKANGPNSILQPCNGRSHKFHFLLTLNKRLTVAQRAQGQYKCDALPSGQAAFASYNAATGQFECLAEQKAATGSAHYFCRPHN
jgi:hypothetical protein